MEIETGHLTNTSPCRHTTPKGCTGSLFKLPVVQDVCVPVPTIIASEPNRCTVRSPEGAICSCTSCYQPCRQKICEGEKCGFACFLWVARHRDFRYCALSRSMRCAPTPTMCSTVDRGEVWAMTARNITCHIAPSNSLPCCYLDGQTGLNLYSVPVLP